jgi:two-component system, NtrC family, sensor histidine kinase HydH
MPISGHKGRIFLIVALIAGITALHYTTDLSARHYHVFHLGVYFFPVILAGFWFGLVGGLATSLSVTMLSLPFLLRTWHGFSANDLHNIKILLLYNVVAIMLGILSDREQAEQRRLQEAQSLAAMGRALAGVAHDMRTPLVAIGGFTRLVQKHIEKDNPHRDKLDIVLREVERMENMVKDMLDFSRPLELTLSNENANQVITECLSVLEYAAQERHLKLQSELTADLPPVRMDISRMKQVIINLIMNAVQASPEGETVTVSTFKRGGEMVIDITDCGCGIPSDIREEIFLPFVTTKKEGTGLGLAITRKIIEAHRGRIEMLDNPGKGLTFRVVTPFS